MFKLSSFLFENIEDAPASSREKEFLVSKQKAEDLAIDFVERLQDELGEQLSYEMTFTNAFLHGGSTVALVTIEDANGEFERLLHINKYPYDLEPHFSPSNEEAFKGALSDLKSLLYGSKKKTTVFDSIEMWVSHIFPRLKEQNLSITSVEPPNQFYPFVSFMVYGKTKTMRKTYINCSYNIKAKELKITGASGEETKIYNIFEDLDGDPQKIANTIAAHIL